MSESDPKQTRSVVGDDPEGDRPLVGSLSQLSASDLLQAAESARRSGTLRLSRGDIAGTLWLHEGRIVDSRTTSGLRGREAALQLVLWDRGSFEADFREIEVAERIHESTSFLLLEAARRQDESERDRESPPHAALADPPPLPPRPLRALHRSLTVLSVASAYTSQYLRAELLAERLERARIEADAPCLDRFQVGPEGQVHLVDPHPPLGDHEVEGLVRDVSRWIGDFFRKMEHALPGRFGRHRLRYLTEAVKEDLEELGFLRELGLEDDTETR